MTEKKYDLVEVDLDELEVYGNHLWNLHINEKI
jgi:hypothetical protein